MKEFISMRKLLLKTFYISSNLVHQIQKLAWVIY